MGVQHQVDHVRKALGGVPVVGVLCFVTADWPFIGGSFVVRGVHAPPPRLLAKALARSTVGPVDVAATVHLLDRRFRPA